MAKPAIGHSYSVENDKKFAYLISKALKKVSSLKDPLELVRDDFYKSEKAIFMLKSAGKYPDFKNEESRQGKERTAGFEYPLLVRSGKLMRSMLNYKDTNAIYKLTNTSLTIGTKAKNKKGVTYPIFHQLGTKNMKMRKFLFIGPEAKKFANSDQIGRLQRWIGYVESYVISAVEALGETR